MCVGISLVPAGHCRTSIAVGTHTNLGSRKFLIHSHKIDGSANSFRRSLTVLMMSQAMTALRMWRWRKPVSSGSWCVESLAQAALKVFVMGVPREFVVGGSLRRS
jgi:hypothetical protein